MIIWLSGAYGVGKSTLADALCAQLPGAAIFDAEEVGNAVRGSYPGQPYGDIFEDYPLWGSFCCQLLRDLHGRHCRHLLVPMTLLRRASYGRIIRPLLDDGIDLRLIVLEASRQTIRDRILARGEHEDCWCMQHIGLSSEGARQLPGAWRLSTEGRGPDELARAVLAQLAGGGSE